MDTTQDMKEVEDHLFNNIPFEYRKIFVEGVECIEGQYWFNPMKGMLSFYIMDNIKFLSVFQNAGLLSSDASILYLTPKGIDFYKLLSI